MLQDTKISGYKIKLIRELISLNALTLNVCQQAIKLQVYSAISTYRYKQHKQILVK